MRETSFDGATLAWKNIYCRHAIRLNDRGEIESVERLRHKHISVGNGSDCCSGPLLSAFLEDLETS